MTVTTPVKHQPFTEQVKIYPNPASDYLILSPYPDYKFEIQIVGTNGQTVMRKMNLMGENRISLAGLPKGAYMIKVLSTEGTMYIKFY